MDSILLDRIVNEEIMRVLAEGAYDDSATPILKARGEYNNGAEYGSRPNNDVPLMPSTFDRNGERFHGNMTILPDNKFVFYKIKNFGNDRIEGTISFFGPGSDGEKRLRDAIDTLSAGRNKGYNAIYRIVTSQGTASLCRRTHGLKGGFYEFSLDDGRTWCILKPNPTSDMKVSKLVIRSGN